MSDGELADINAFRAEYGLSPLRPGRVKCLRCDDAFESWDRARNRICPACKHYDEVYGVTAGSLDEFSLDHLESGIAGSILNSGEPEGLWLDEEG